MAGEQTSDNDSAQALLHHGNAFHGLEDMEEQDVLRRQLADFETQHRDLDDVIARISDTAPFDQLQVQRLKKRKLMLKDGISRLKAILLPDIIA